MKYSFEKAYAEFASTLTDNTSYFGTDAAPWVLAALTQNKLADLAGNTVQDINESAPIGKLSVADAVQYGQHCDFTPSGTTTLANVLLTPKEIWLDHEICYDDLRGVYNGLSNATEAGIEPGAAFMQALQEAYISAFNKAVMQQALYSATGTSMSITGMIPQITTNVTNIASSAITKSTIIATMENLILSLGSTQGGMDTLENGEDGLVWMMNQRTLKLYQFALAASGAAWNQNPVDGKPRTMDGHRIETISSMSNGDIVLIDTSNIALGVGSMNEFASFSMVDFRKTTLDRKLGMTLQGRFDIKVLYEAEAAANITL